MGQVTNNELLDYDLETVWRWFATPGAMTRLIPPFFGAKVLQEASNLRDGVAKFQPAFGPIGGPVWQAQHDPDGYVEGRRFEDYAASAPYRQLTGWRHIHKFEADGARTVVRDEIDARFPEPMLRSFFAFRAARLRADLAARERYRRAPMTIAVTGASGLVGTQLAALLGLLGHRVIRLERGEASGPDARKWNPDAPASDLLDGVDALVHLAGASIAGRFTPEHKQAVRESRVGPTRRLAELVRDAGVETFVCASAIGVYGAKRGDEELTEDAAPGHGFLAYVVRDWEAACEPARGSARVVNVRTGVVLSAAGGMLGMLAPVFKAGIGGRVGSGEQWFSWIALDDLLEVYLDALFSERLSGPVNAVSPSPVTNAEFTRVLGEVLRRPTVLPVPGAAPKVLLGSEGAREVALADQRVVPAVLQSAGHPFRFADLEAALRFELGR